MPDGKLRMPNVNRVTVSGRLTRDPEVKDIGGTKLLSLGIAVSRKFKKNDEWQEETGFYDVDHWSDYALRAADALRKGGPVMIEGSLHYRTYEKDGDTRTAISIRADRVIPLDWNDDQQQTGNAPRQQQPAPRATQDDIPFD